MFLSLFSQNVLTILIFFPLLCALCLFAWPKMVKVTKLPLYFAFVAALVEFIFSLHLVFHFSSSSSQFQFAQVFALLPETSGIRYLVGVDGLSLSLVMLSTTFTLFAMLVSFTSISQKLPTFLGCILMLESALVGAFVSVDALIFYIFWEFSLIPLYLMIGIWGGKERVYATLKFFVYGVVGSLLMLVAFAYLYVHTADATGSYSSSFLSFYQTAASLPFETQCGLFLAVTLAFGIKVPLFPFYTWLPDTYEQAPAVYTVLSGVVLKLATYGLVRLSLCLFPAAAEYFAQPILILAVIGILYGALIAWRQTNVRRIMAFSSLSHLGFIVIGIFAFQEMALQGALYQMLNHAITAGAFFILFNFLYEKKSSFRLDEFGGLAKVLPWFAFFFVVTAMGSVALPSTGSFVGEWLILVGLFQTSPIIGAIAATGVVFGAVYVLWITYRLLFGHVKKTQTLDTPRLRTAEVLQLSLLTVAIFVFGFASSALLQHTQATLLNIEKTAFHKSPYYQAGFVTGSGETLEVGKR